MLSSMTAYSRVQKKLAHCDIVIEIASVNKRTLDIQLKLPPFLAFLECELRKSISEKIARGMLSVRLQLLFTKELPVEVQLNRPLLEKIRKAAPELELSDLIALLPHDYSLLELIPEQKQVKEVHDVLEEALHALNEMRAKEGSLIEKEFFLRCDSAEAALAVIEKQAEKSVEKAKKKLTALLGAEMDERVAKELVLLADKVDISEEISRFRMHLNNFRSTMQKEKAAGKKLEFIIQELLREVNTMGSKSQDGLIIEQVIEIKCELEKIREQVQNVE